MERQNRHQSGARTRIFVHVVSRPGSSHASPAPPEGRQRVPQRTGKTIREQVSGGGDQPQCFYGGAFPQLLRTKARRNVRGLSPKAKSGDESSAPTRWESRLSLCVSFDSDLLDEGDLGGKKREEREEGSEVLEAWCFFYEPKITVGPGQAAC